MDNEIEWGHGNFVDGVIGWFQSHFKWTVKLDEVEAFLSGL